MQKYLLICIFTFFFSISTSAAFSQVAPQYEELLSKVFNFNRVPKIILEFEEKEWNKLLEYYDYNPKNEEYVHADFYFIDGQKKIKLKNSGVKIRGNTSRRRPEGSKGEMHQRNHPDWNFVHFKVDFEQYHKKNELYTLEGLILKFFKDDYTKTREIYCYDLFRRFGVWTAPRASYAKLEIHILLPEGMTNIGDYGTYEMIEPIDEEFIKKRFIANDDGFLWKCLYGRSGPADLRFTSDISRITGVEEIKLNERYSKRYTYDLKTNKKDLDDAAELFFEFVSNLNYVPDEEFHQWAEQHIEVDLFLRFLAVNTLVGMWDDYWVNGNNYYIYLDEEKKMFFVPYDYDNTLGTSMLVRDSGTQSVIRWGTMRKRSKPLASRILSIPEYQEKYQSYLKELINPQNKLFDSESSISRIKNWQNLIGESDNDIGDYEEFIDLPAGWGNQHGYRLLSGSADPEASVRNYFKVRENTVKKELNLGFFREFFDLFQ